MKKRRISFGFFVAVVAWLALAVALLPAARAESPMLDTDQSKRLTDFLKSNRLPLVSAQVLRSPGGGQSVMLYGYTATEVGKSNAEKRTRLFLKDSQVSITNRIKVRPELASMRSPSASLPPPQAGTEPPPLQHGDIQKYQSQQAEAERQQYLNQQAQQYMYQQNSASSLVNALIPLVGLALAIGLGGGSRGFGIGVSPGFGSSYPYGRYGSPYGGGYGYPYPYGPSPAPSPYGVPGTGNP